MVCYPKRVFKNEDIDIAINVPEDEVNEFSLYILTDKETKVEVPLSAVTDGVVHFEPGDLDLLNDGIIRYELSYSVGDNDYAESTNTNLILKTPSTYSAKTAEDWYNEGYEAGLNDCSGETPDCSEAYQSGYTEGVSEQKAKLTGLTANTNMIYERTDGYDRVVVNVPTGYSQSDLDNAYDSGYTAGLNDCSGETPDCTDAYNSGWTEGTRQAEEVIYTGLIENAKDITFTTNGIYTNDVGLPGHYSAWTAVTVNVAQTGYTQADLDAAFQSGWTGGYSSGFTDGYNYCGKDYEERYLTFELLTDGNIHFARRGDDTQVRYYHRVNGGEWVSHVFSGSSNQVMTFTFNGQAGDIVEYKGDVPSGSAVGAFIDGGSITHTGAMYKVYGNIMSFIDSTGYTTATTLTTSGFNGFFNYCTGLTDASNLILPTTTIADCYGKMFIGCTNLTTAPELPATILAENCYNQMFSGCTNLNYIKCLATDISANGSTYNWVGGVASTGTFTKAAAMNDWTRGIDGIPVNWTVFDAS